MPATTIIGRFHERVRTHPEKVALRYKDRGAGSAGPQNGGAGSADRGAIPGMTSPGGSMATR